MKVKIITENKAQFLPILELADDIAFINDYLERGVLWARYDADDLTAVMLLTEEDDWLEIQNLAVPENFQGQGKASQLIGYFLDCLEHYPNHYKGVKVRTDEYTAVFYEKCGFIQYKRVANYFLEKYGHPVFDKRRELIDNVYLRRSIK